MNQLQNVDIDSKIRSFINKKTSGKHFSEVIADWILEPESDTAEITTGQFEALPWGRKARSDRTRA